MKKFYKTMISAVALCVVGAADLSAQALSGVYSINSASPTSGTNFQNFTAMASALNTNGIAGGVTVNVVANSGPYNEQITLNAITGTSANNRIVINGNNNLITFNSTTSSAPHIIGLNGTDYLTINNLNFSGTGTYAYDLILYGGADFNVFSACTFSVPMNNTSSNQIPIVFSGSGTTYASASNSGNYNTITNCQTSSGYAGISMYGMTSGTYNGYNQILNCTIEDFYLYGIYSYYHWYQTISNNLIRRLNRTTFTTTYGISASYAQGNVVDGNRIQSLFNMNNTTTGTTYCIYFYNYQYPLPSSPAKNTLRNNIVSDIRTNGTIYAIYGYYADGYIYHNTISLDNTASTAGTTYGFYGGTQTGQEIVIRDNIITITRGGSGTKYGVYSLSSSLISVDNNNIYVNSSGGTNYHGYNNGTFATNLAAWQATGYDQNGTSLDPMYASLSTNDLHPTNTALNNTGAPVGVYFDADGYVRNATTPDVGALEFLTPTCTNTPSNSVTGPNYSLCPGESASFGIGNLSSDLGYTYQWQASSTSSVGPFTTISGANSIFYTAPSVTTTMWYSVIITCTNPGGGTTTAVKRVNIAGTTTNTIPYYESFENIGLNNRLPNCSWSSPNQGSTAKTFTAAGGSNNLPNTGSSFAAFANGSAGTSYYYTNGIYMNAGITYSASVWFQTDLSGSTNWTNFSLLYGTSQSSTGLTQIASTNGPAVSPIYKSLSNTFMVPTSGMYYVAIRATGATGGAPFLSWDDLSIIIPCTPTLNTPTLGLTVSSSTICSGEMVSLTATGANTYMWTGGATGSTFTDTPISNTTYMVTGTNTLTGCSANLSQNVMVKQSPNVSVFAFPPVVCSGKATNLQASGAAFYNWTSGGTSANEIVYPTSSQSYTVQGTGTNGCSTSAVISVSVNNTPTVTASASNGTICAGDPVTLIGTGASSYQWVSTNPASVLQGNNAVAYPSTSVSYTVTGTDPNGCENTAIVSVAVNSCVGLNSYALAAGLSVYPNPTNGEFTVELSNGKINTVTVSDVTGRILLSNTVTDKTGIDIRGFAAGVYYVKVSNDSEISVIKIVKE